MAVQAIIRPQALLLLVSIALSAPLAPVMGQHAASAPSTETPPALPPQAASEIPHPESEPVKSLDTKPADNPPLDSSQSEASNGDRKDHKPDPKVRDTDTREAMCLMIESAAKAQDLPLEFFARLIWQESRFQSDAVGPVTRNGQRAQGIAQFMPGTASERRLLDPFDPVQALPKSAEFLNELRDQFGNPGLAAAAYNAGPRRVQEWLAGSGYMPQETRNYVFAITGSSVDDWAAAVKSDNKNVKTPAAAPASSCRELMALLTRAPNPFVAQLEQHIQLGADKLWGVQLAAGFNRDMALAMYARAMKRLSGVIGDQDTSLLGSVFRSRGTRAFYQVRIGADTRPAADDLCAKIRRAGGACFVLRNMKFKG